MGEPWALGIQTPSFFGLSKYKYEVKIAGSNPGGVQPLGECCGVYSKGILCCNGLSIDTHLIQATNPTNAWAISISCVVVEKLCVSVGIFFFFFPFMLHLQNTGSESTGKAMVVRQMWWACVCSFVFRARAEGPGMSVNKYLLSSSDWQLGHGILGCGESQDYSVLMLLKSISLSLGHKRSSWLLLHSIWSFYWGSIIC